LPFFWSAAIHRRFLSFGWRRRTPKKAAMNRRTPKENSIGERRRLQFESPADFGYERG
jgi:hypothetical protein